MTTIQTQLNIETSGRNTYNITHKIEHAIQESGIETGLCHVFIHHTSASLIITENADPDVRIDLEMLIQRMAPDGDPEYKHTLEGIDDMSGHMRTILTATELTIPKNNTIAETPKIIKAFLFILIKFNKSLNSLKNFD
ncbi:TPA: YjbQ family protein [Candidatus Bathyarchaeota archaeon]|nr:YjbQ family protein [Candidatus Bathyarchaeota archaeon]